MPEDRKLSTFRWLMKHVFVPLATALIGAAGAGWAVWVQKDAEVKATEERSAIRAEVADELFERMAEYEDTPEAAPAEVVERISNTYSMQPERAQQVQADWARFRTKGLPPNMDEAFEEEMAAEPAMEGK